MAEVQAQFFVLLFVLYYLQGIPYGIQIRSLPLYFFDVLKYPVETVANLNLLMIPWIVLKPLVICFIDIRHHCAKTLYICLIANVILNLFLFFLFAVPGYFDLVLMMALFFLVNCFTVVFDIATDELIITSATSATDMRFFGLSNAVQIVAFKFGASFSGILLHFLDYTHISSFFLCASAFSLIAVFLVRIAFKRYLNKTNLVQDLRTGVHHKINFIQIVEKTFHTKGNKLFFLYIITYKMGEIGAIFNLPLFMLEAGIKRSDILFLTTAVCEPCSLIGSLLAGFIWSFVKGIPRTLLQMLALVSVLRLIPLLIQYYLFYNLTTMHNSVYNILCVSMPLLWFLSGMVTAFATVLMMMITSLVGKNTYAGYSYAIFSSSEIFGRVAFSSQVGKLVKCFGKQIIFAVFNVLVLINGLYLFFIKPYILQEFKAKRPYLIVCFLFSCNR